MGAAGMGLNLKVTPRLGTPELQCNVLEGLEVPIVTRSCTMGERVSLVRGTDFANIHFKCQG